ncbi:hypothetical protein K439DRAFT_1616584 [Ramaria rubella]|nr:hypothetical protein K439DRAFT_1616584 [Ramaria rubella]
MSPNWPKSVLRAFGIIVPGDLESAWYPAWGPVLNTLFPFEEDYLVSWDYGGQPKALTLSEDGQLQAIDFMVTYIVERFNVPIFFVEVKVLTDLKSATCREYADVQMRGRFKLFGEVFNQLNNQEDVAVPFIYGISAMGTRMAIYKYDIEEGTMDPPCCLTKLKGYRSDTAPLINWSYNMLTDEGEWKLRELAVETKNVVKEWLSILDNNISTFKAQQTQQMVQTILDGVKPSKYDPNVTYSARSV